LGSLFAVILYYFGFRLRYRRAYGLLAGYNTASATEKKKYDVEGLAHHVGNGLMTMAVLLVAAAISVALGSIGWCLGFMGLFVFVAILIVIGGRKFMPDPPQLGEHRFLKAIVPQRAFEAMRQGTRQWLIECKCGSKVDYWDAGGVRYKAAGEPRQLTPCAACGTVTWQKVRRKTPEEQLSVPGRPAVRHAS
jgi:hypothetical protein